MYSKNLSKKNILKIKNKIKSNENKLPQEIIRDILLFSESRNQIIEKKVLEESKKKVVIHYIEFDCNISRNYFFTTSKIYNPLTQMLVSSKNMEFNSRIDILNYISSCGYRQKESNYCNAYIYIPQDIMIKEYLMKNEK